MSQSAEELIDRLTDRSQAVLLLAHEESLHSKRQQINTGDILIGLMRERRAGVASHVLLLLGATVDTIRAALEQSTDSEQRSNDDLRETISIAFREMSALDHNYVGTEHLLLALMHHENSIAVRTLATLNVSPDQVRKEIMFLLKPQTQVAEAKELHARVDPVFVPGAIRESFIQAIRRVVRGEEKLPVTVSPDGEISVSEDTLSVFNERITTKVMDAFVRIVYEETGVQITYQHPCHLVEKFSGTIKEALYCEIEKRTAEKEKRP